MLSDFLKKYFFQQNGFAALLATMIVLSIVLIVVSSLSLVTIIEQKISANTVHSAQAYYAAESGIEDSLYRLIKNKNYYASNSLEVGTGNATITISNGVSQKNILVTGEKNSRARSLQIKINTGGQSTSFYYGAQVGEGGLVMDNSSEVQGDVFSNGSIQGNITAVITGDAWVANKGLIPDQQSLTNNADFTVGQANPAIDAAQSFIPASSGNLIKVSLLLKKVGAPASKTVRILNDNNGSPSKTLSASGAYGTLNTGQINDSYYSWIDIYLNSAATLQAGTKYWISIDSSLNSGDYLLWGENSSDSYSGGTGKYSLNWNAKTPVWFSADGDLAFKSWFGQANTFLNQVQVYANAHANTISNSTISGDAYYQTLYNSTVIGNKYPNSADPTEENTPVSQEMIDGWKVEAEAGGTINGDYILDGGEIGSLGPKKIIGNLTVSNGGDLTVKGTIYVTGNINLYNNALVRLDSNYGDYSGAIVTDGMVNVSNGCVFHGVGDNSYLLIISNLSGQAINLNNNSDTALFCAPNGTITVNNNAVLKELTAKQIHLNNGAKVIYEDGLASVLFSAGAGGSWAITNWEEVP